MSQSKEAKSIIPKVVIIIAVVIVIISVAVFAAFWALGNFVRGKLAQEGINYNMSTNSDTASFTYSEDGENVSLQAGDNAQLPANYPEQLIYPNGKVAAVVQTDEGSAVSYTLDGVEQATVEKWYRDTLVQNNYKITGPVSDSFMAFEQGDTTGIVAISSREGHTYVQINMGTKNQ